MVFRIARLTAENVSVEARLLERVECLEQQLRLYAPHLSSQSEGDSDGEEVDERELDRLMAA